MAPTVVAQDAMPVKQKDNKKQRRKEEQAAAVRRDQELRQLVRAAEADGAPLAALGPFAKFERNGLSAVIEAFSGESLPAELKDWALELCKTNMKEFYESVWGWKDAEKKRQLNHESSRFLVVFGGGDGAAAGSGSAAGGAQRTPLAYVNYRFEVEEGDAVAYCYEVQLEEAARRKGLGKHLMQLLELMAARAGMSDVLLTVMRANADAASFYARLGYKEHWTSPGYDEDSDPTGYVILHKALPKRRGAPAAGAAK